MDGWRSSGPLLPFQRDQGLDPGYVDAHPLGYLLVGETEDAQSLYFLSQTDLASVLHAVLQRRSAMTPKGYHAAPVQTEPTG